jgi:hypothetical protein
MTRNSLDPFDVAQYAVQRRQAARSYGTQSAALALQQRQGTSDYAQGLSQYGLQFLRQRNAMPGRWLGRGMLNSGFFKDAYSGMLTDQNNKTNELKRKYLQQQEGYTLQQQLLQAQLSGSLSDIAQLKSAQRSSKAAALRGLV